MTASTVLENLITVVGDLRGELVPSRPAFLLLKDLLIQYFRSSPLAREGGGPVKLAPFGELDFPYRSMGAIDTVDLFGIDELLIFAFYWANRSLYRKTIDVGANVGLHSILMTRAGFQVTAFEPDPLHYGWLEENLQRNNVGTVTLKRAAISDSEGEMEFVRVLGNTTGSHLAGAKANPFGPLERFKVPVMAFAKVAAEADFAKVDAEGHEVVILKSVPRETWQRLDVMAEIGTADNASALFAHLSGLGVGMFAQKIGWQRATKAADLPTSHREGSLFITMRDRLPWGDAQRS
jgi:FkbM family methyltransferase